MKTPKTLTPDSLGAATGSAIRLRDGRAGRVESVSQHGMLWIRDGNGNLSSADPKTGWSGDGNWANDISPNSDYAAGVAYPDRK